MPIGNSALTDALAETKTSQPVPPEAEGGCTLGELQNQLFARLSGPDPTSADELYGRLTNVAGWLDRGFEALHARVKRLPNARAIEDALLEMLLRRADLSFGNFKTLIKILELGVEEAQEERVCNIVEAAIADDSVPPPRVHAFDLLPPLARLGPRKVQLLAQLKYKGSERFTSNDILGIAGDLARRLDLSYGFEDRLFEVASNTAVDKTSWISQVKQAFAIDIVTSDHFMTLNFPNDNRKGRHPRFIEAMRGLLDMESMKREFQFLDRAMGTLFLCFHGGFLSFIKFGYTEVSKDGFVLGSYAGERWISALDPLAALYQGVRAIQDGKSILMASDGRRGKATSSMAVLGLDIPVTDGAPFIAYETGCETIWLAVKRHRNGFSPEFVRGPSRRAGERFASFRERWYSFYARQIELTLIGDPANLTLKPQWLGLLSRNVDPRQIVP